MTKGLLWTRNQAFASRTPEDLAERDWRAAMPRIPRDRSLDSTIALMAIPIDLSQIGVGATDWTCLKRGFCCGRPSV